MRYRSFEDWERDDLIANLVGDMKQCPEAIQLRMVWHFWHCDEDYGRRVAEGAGIDLQKALALPPLPGKPAPGKDRAGPTYSDGTREAAARLASGDPRLRVIGSPQRRGKGYGIRQGVALARGSLPDGCVTVGRYRSCRRSSSRRGRR